MARSLSGAAPTKRGVKQRRAEASKLKGEPVRGGVCVPRSSGGVERLEQEPPES